MSTIYIITKICPLYLGKMSMEYIVDIYYNVIKIKEGSETFEGTCLMFFTLCYHICKRAEK